MSTSAAARLGMPAKGKPEHNEVLDNAPMCDYTASGHHLGLLLTAVTDHGIESFGPEKVAGKISKTTVNGMTAYQNQPQDAPPGSDFCTVTVGVHPGQALDVLFHEDAVEQSIGQSALCTKAKQAAQFAISGLAAR